MENNNRCDQSQMFVQLNERIKKTMSNDGAETRLIKEGNFEKVFVGGKTPQPLMKGEWQLKVVKIDDAVKYIIVINKEIVKFGGGCKYNNFVQTVREGKGVDIICTERDGSKSKGNIKAVNVKSKKFTLHKFRTSDGEIIAFVAEFM